MAATGQMADYNFLKMNSKKKSRWNTGFVVNEKQQPGNPKVFTGGFHGCKAIDELQSKQSV